MRKPGPRRRPAHGWRTTARRSQIFSEDWSAEFGETLPDEPDDTIDAVVRRIASASKGSKTILIVRFPDGETIDERKAANTFIHAIGQLGPGRVAALGLELNRLPLVSRSKPETEYAYGSIDGWFVGTHSSTDAKRRQLIEIARRLDVPLEIRVVRP